MDVNQGQCDSPLTENGINQALAAKEWFKNQKIHFDSVYSSTAERACDTAWLVSGMPYERKKGLKEIFLGTKEASPNSENRNILMEIILSSLVGKIWMLLQTVFMGLSEKLQGKIPEKQF